jgi:hypothetical protein
MSEAVYFMIGYPLFHLLAGVLAVKGGTAAGKGLKQDALCWGIACGISEFLAISSVVVSLYYIHISR